MGEKHQPRLHGYVSMKMNSKYENNVILFNKYPKYGETLCSAILTCDFNDVENFRFSVILMIGFFWPGKATQTFSDVYVNKGKNHLCFIYISPSFWFL